MFSALCTHPLDTLKIRLQTSTVQSSLVRTTVDIISKEGVLALYAGVSASLLRQATYSTVRFGAYDYLKSKLDARDNFYKQLFAACVGGAAGGIVGSPADLTNVRMQNDGKLPVEKRRGYKNAFHGIYRIATDEGASALFRGLGPNVQRAILMTASQVVSYDVIKLQMLSTGFFKDNLVTHFGASLSAGLIATTVCSPIDVLKTRIMAAEGKPYSGVTDAFVKILRSEGPSAFLKGWIPSFTRLGPHTIITFIAYEQLKTWYGMLRAWKETRA
ncbi:Mitochondrial dicarboxylate transporter [Dinochytrium kinnereticum]|nr:Mitochondrial dicarboxylate transporter [Dinochytrium kinnereticum]